MFYVYVLKMSNGQTYAGFSSDLRRRLREHQSGGNKTTRKYLPVQLIFYEAYIHEGDARRREQYFKTTKGKNTLRIMLKETFGNGSL
ncbi:MAG: GIY-YIG nuclease family protein [Patescibacteria group bacterium]